MWVENKKLEHRVDGVLGIWTIDRSMEGADESSWLLVNLGLDQ